MSQEQEAKKSTEAEKHAALYPGMRSEQSIIEERKIDPYAGETPVIPLDSHEKPEFAAAYPGMRAPDRVLDEKARQARIEEDQKGIKESLQDIADEVELEMAKRHARVVQRRQQQTQGHLRNDEMRLVIESMKTGGITPLPTADEAMETVLQDEKALLQETGGIKGVLGRLNRATMAEVDPKPEKQPPNPELLQKPLPAPEVLTAKVDHKKINEYIEAAKNLPTPELITDERFLNDNLADKTPTEILQQLKLNNLIKIEDIEIDTPNGKRIDPTKKEYLINAIRLKSITQREAEKASIKVPEEINTKYKGSRDALDKIRAAIKQNTDAKEDVAAEQKLRGYIDLFRKKVKAEFSRAYSPTAIEDFVLPVAKVFVGELQSELPGITPEEFLAAVSVIESQENVQKASQDFQKKVFEQFNSGIQRKLLDSPLWIKIKREDIVSPAELDALLAEYKRNPTPALEQELAGYTSHTDNREQAIKFYGLSGLIQPRDIRTDNVYEITEAVDNDRSIFFQNAIRLKHIVHDRLNQKVDSIVKAEFGTSPSTSIDAYTKLQAFIAEKNPDATADDKRLLQEYYMGFGEMVNQEIRKQSLIFKDQERVFIDIGKHKATKIPARVVLSTARKVAAERFVRANQAQLPEGMTPEQFLAGMSIADTYRFSEDKLKEEVFDWYRKNKPRQNKDYDEGKESMPRRRIPVPFLRRGQGPTPPETPPAPQPPIGPGNGPDNQPPGGNPPPENPPTPPGNGGAAGGVPSPDNPPPSQPGDGEEEDTVTFDVDQPPPGADENPDDQPSARYAEPAHPQGVTIDGQATVVNNTPNGNSVENAQPAPQMRRSLRNELTPRKLSEHAVKLYKKSKDRARRAVKLAYEGSPYELSEGLLRSAIKVQDIETTALIDYDQFSDRLNGFRGDEGADIRRRVENMNENDILDEWGLDGEFNERSVKNDENREELLDAIYIREISRDVFHSNEDAFEEEVKKVSPESVAQFNRFESSVIDFLPEYLGQVADFQMRMLGRNKNLNPVTAAQYANSERFRIASKIFDENKNIMPADATPEQFLAALSVGESLLEMSDGIFNDLYAAYEYQENHVIPTTPAQTGSETSVPLIPAQKERRRNIMDRVFPKRENPAVYLQSDNLLITAPKVKNVVTSRLIKINDVINTSLPKFRDQEKDRILRMEIENRDLNDIVTKWRLRTLFSESYIAGDNETIRDSALLVDAIILREISRKYFEQLKPNFDAQLATVVPKQSLEQYQAHKSEVLKIYPEFQQVFLRQYNSMRRSHLTSEDDAETRRKDLIASRNIAAREIFDRNRNEMPEGSTPEKLLAALSVQETYSQIQDKIFQDLYHVYISSTPSDNDESGTPPNEPPPPRPGGGPSRNPPPAPSSPSTTGMSRYDLQPGDNPGTTLVNETGPSNFHTVVDRNEFLQKDPLKNLQDRIRNLANSNN